MNTLSKYAGNARKIIKTDSDGNVVAIYESVRQAAEENGVVMQTICRWAKDEKKHGGYTYEYEKKPAFQMPIRQTRGRDSFQRKPYYRGNT